VNTSPSPCPSNFYRFFPSELCVSVAGFKPVGPICDLLIEPSFSTPTLHVLGRTDVVVVEERSKALLDVSANKRVEWHDGGELLFTHARRIFDSLPCLQDTMFLLKPVGEFSSESICQTPPVMLPRLYRPIYSSRRLLHYLKQIRLF
jgi:hypothetical protein